jgi:hypothetical protein
LNTGFFIFHPNHLKVIRPTRTMLLRQSPSKRSKGSLHPFQLTVEPKLSKLRRVSQDNEADKDQLEKTPKKRKRCDSLRNSPAKRPKGIESDIGIKIGIGPCQPFPMPPLGPSASNFEIELRESFCKQWSWITSSLLIQRPNLCSRSSSLIG